MLTSLDHIVLLCNDIEGGIKAYTRVFGREPDWRSENKDDGYATALFRFENTALELMAPLDRGSVSARFEKILQGREGAITSLVFATDDLSSTHHVLSRRGLEPSDITDGQSRDLLTGIVRKWKRFRLNDVACAGIKTFVLEPEIGKAKSEIADRDGVLRLDHIVIHTPNPTRAIAQYAGRLGLRFALDRTIEAFSTRFLFFRIGELTLEVVHRLDQDHEVHVPDSFWGLTWQVADLRRAYARLGEAGMDVSEIRKGRKPGTRVFTLRNGTLGAPTLFLETEPR